MGRGAMFTKAAGRPHPPKETRRKEFHQREETGIEESKSRVAKRDGQKGTREGRVEDWGRNWRREGVRGE